MPGKIIIIFFTRSLLLSDEVSPCWTNRKYTIFLLEIHINSSQSSSQPWFILLSWSKIYTKFFFQCSTIMFVIFNVILMRIFHFYMPALLLILDSKLIPLNSYSPLKCLLRWSSSCRFKYVRYLLSTLVPNMDKEDNLSQIVQHFSFAELTWQMYASSCSISVPLLPPLYRAGWCRSRTKNHNAWKLKSLRRKLEPGKWDEKSNNAKNKHRKKSYRKGWSMP